LIYVNCIIDLRKLYHWFTIFYLLFADPYRIYCCTGCERQSISLTIGQLYRDKSSCPLTRVFKTCRPRWRGLPITPVNSHIYKLKRERRNDLIDCVFIQRWSIYILCDVLSINCIIDNTVWFKHQSKTENCMSGHVYFNLYKLYKFVYKLSLKFV